MAERLNKLTGKTWLQYSFSIWRDIQKNTEERKLKHPAMFPISMGERLIEIFSNNNNELVLDPFMGSGSTIIAAQIKQMKGIGVELSKEYCEMAKKRLEETYKSMFEEANYKIICDSALNIGKHLKPKSIDITITSPPYWDILNRKRSADKKDIQNYGNSKHDLGNIESYEEFLNLLQNVFKEVYVATKPNRYCIVVVMDIRKKSKLYPFHQDITKKMEEIGFNLNDIIIWDRQKEYNSMRPLGYPYSFIVNKVHEYILIFRKGEK
ncbi:MAG: DNA methyltransferase [Candidatus Omnitrophica bacterium]|nr:DNA methyltransferase [Candidatus Omnitrophota bacterium]